MRLTMGAVGALGIGVICAIIDWVAVIRSNRRLAYVFKPATLIAFVAAAFLIEPSGGAWRLALWFRAALLFSLAGDIFLMLPDDRWFLPGLVAFLMGHLCYIVGFNATAPPLGLLVPLVVAALVDFVVLRRIIAGLHHTGDTSLRLPVVVYGIILSLTLVSGWTTWFRPAWSVMGRVTASLGGTLFYASDLMLAWDRFVRNSRWLHVLVIVTYHLGQLALTLTIASAP
jgi:uncharacterized membrane protein YhhN